jgi:hypothetical protein
VRIHQWRAVVKGVRKFSPKLHARIIAQTCLAAGLSNVYTELLDFEGELTVAAQHDTVECEIGFIES